MMRKLQLILVFWMLLEVFGFWSTTTASAQTTVPPGITFVTSGFNWSHSSSTSLTDGTAGTVKLTPCPLGVDYTSGAGYMVYIADSANGNESVSVTSGSPGSGNCSITFTPVFSHGGTLGSYTIGSASTGIQETLNYACGANGAPYLNSQCHVIIPANGPNEVYNTYNVYGTIYLHSNQILLD
jgi:hypothetical protein